MAVKALMTDETGKQIVDAIREKAGLEERVSDLEKNKVDKSSIAQTTGTAEDKVMSQRAATEELEKKFDKSNVVQSTGDAEDKVMSQAAATKEFAQLSEEIDAESKIRRDAIAQESAARNAAVTQERNRAVERENKIEELFSLPTQEAVDKWLDEHPDATTTVQDESLDEKKFTAAARKRIEQKTICYNSIAEMKSDTSLKPGMNVMTSGYYAANDGGGGEYIVRAKTADDIDDGGRIHDMGELVAELVVQETANVKQFGAIGLDDCSQAFYNATQAYPDGEIYVPAGIYTILNPVEVTTWCSIRMHKDARIWAGAEMDAMFNITSDPYPKRLREFSGGIVDGRAYAKKGINVTWMEWYCIRDCCVRNCTDYAIYVGGCNVKVRNVFLECGGLPDNQNNDFREAIVGSAAWDKIIDCVGLYTKSTDSVYENIRAKYFKTGFIFDRCGTNTTVKKCHAWALSDWRVQREAMNDTTAFDIRNTSICLYDCAMDTVQYGIKSTDYQDVKLLHCSFISHVNQNLSPCHVLYGNAVYTMENCLIQAFSEDFPVTIATNPNNAKLRNCTFSSPFYCTDTYYAATNTPSFDSFQIKLSDFSVPANGYKSIEVPLNARMRAFARTHHVANISGGNMYLPTITYKTSLGNNTVRATIYNNSDAQVNMSGVVISVMLLGYALTITDIGKSIEYTVK